MESSPALERNAAASCFTSDCSGGLLRPALAFADSGLALLNVWLGTALMPRATPHCRSERSDPAVSSARFLRARSRSQESLFGIVWVLSQ